MAENLMGIICVLSVQKNAIQMVEAVDAEGREIDERGDAGTIIG